MSLHNFNCFYREYIRVSKLLEVVDVLEDTLELLGRGGHELFDDGVAESGGKVGDVVCLVDLITHNFSVNFIPIFYQTEPS